MFAASELVIDIRHRFRGKCKSNASVGIRVGQYGRVDAYNFAVHIDQWPARVAWINGCIGLDEGLKLP